MELKLLLGNQNTMLDFRQVTIFMRRLNTTLHNRTNRLIILVDSHQDLQMMDTNLQYMVACEKEEISLQYTTCISLRFTKLQVWMA